MAKKTTLLAAFIMLLLGIGIDANAIDRQTLAQYAASLRGKNKSELKTAIYELCQPQTVLGYGSGSGKTWSGFVKTDRIGNTLECRNRYSTDRFFFSSETQTTSISGMNIEHSFPKSWWGGTENNAYKDLYNLYPSESSVNNKKSNYVMGKVTNPTLLDDYEKVGTGDRGSVRMVEPHDNWKGDFCRSYFYMVTVYQDFTWKSEGLNCLENNTYPTLQEWAYTLYLDWTRNDKVDSIEVARNNAVYAIQSNRNLFIDYPYLAEYVWGDSSDVAFDPYTSITTASDDDRYTTTHPDEPDGPVDDVYYFSASNGITPGKQYLIIVNAADTLRAMDALSSSRKYGYPTATNVFAVNDTIALDNTNNAFTIEASGDGYTIKDSKGRYLWHDGTYRTISASSDESDAEAWTITNNGDGTFKILTDGSYYIQYSTRYTSFGCYNSEQGLMPMLYEQVEKAVTPTSINGVQTIHNDAKGAVYTIQGQYVGNDVNILPRGLYIRNGKKIIVR